MLPGSMRCTVPDTISPERLPNSATTETFSASRIFWIITCVAVNQFCILEQNVLFGVKAGQELLVCHFLRGLLYLLFVALFYKTYCRLVHNHFYLAKLRGPCVEVDVRSDNLPLFCIFFFVCCSKRGLYRLDYFLFWYPAFFFKLAQDRLYYFDVKHNFLICF